MLVGADCPFLDRMRLLLDRVRITHVANHVGAEKYSRRSPRDSWLPAVLCDRKQCVCCVSATSWTRWMPHWMMANFSLGHRLTRRPQALTRSSSSRVRMVKHLTHHRCLLATTVLGHQQHSPWLQMLQVHFEHLQHHRMSLNSTSNSQR